MGTGSPKPDGKGCGKKKSKGLRTLTQSSTFKEKPIKMTQQSNAHIKLEFLSQNGLFQNFSLYLGNVFENDSV